MRVQRLEPGYSGLQRQVGATTLGGTYTFSNSNASSSYAQHTYSLLAYKGQSVTVQFKLVTEGSLPTRLNLDDISVITQ